MLGDDAALLAMPSAHHKALIQQAYALYESHIIDADDLSDLLELADAELAFAVETLLDIKIGEQHAMHVLVTPMRKRDVALDPKEQRRYPAIRGQCNGRLNRVSAVGSSCKPCSR